MCYQLRWRQHSRPVVNRPQLQPLPKTASLQRTSSLCLQRCCNPESPCRHHSPATLTQSTSKQQCFSGQNSSPLPTGSAQQHNNFSTPITDLKCSYATRAIGRSNIMMNCCSYTLLSIGWILNTHGIRYVTCFNCSTEWCMQSTTPFSVTSPSSFQHQQVPPWTYQQRLSSCAAPTTGLICYGSFRTINSMVRSSRHRLQQCLHLRAPPPLCSRKSPVAARAGSSALWFVQRLQVPRHRQHPLQRPRQPWGH